MDLYFSVHKLAKFSSNPGRVQSEGLVHLLRYIRLNKSLGLKYYAKIEDAPLYGLLIKSRIITDKLLVVFSDFSLKDCLDTGRSPVAYIVFYQGEPIDHCTNVPVLVAQYSDESEYRSACNSGMDLAHFNMLNNELLKKYPYVVPEQAPLIILDIKPDICIDTNVKETKQTRKFPEE